MASYAMFKTRRIYHPRVFSASSRRRKEALSPPADHFQPSEDARIQSSMYCSGMVGTRNARPHMIMVMLSRAALGLVSTQTRTYINL